MNEVNDYYNIIIFALAFSSGLVLFYTATVPE